jgi:hypothetical protein
MGLGLLAVVLSSPALEYSLLEPIKGLTIGLSDLPYLLAFTLSALLVSWPTAAWRRAAYALRRAYGAMEANVQEQTAGLGQGNEPLQIEIAERKRGRAARKQLPMCKPAAHEETVAAQHRFREMVNSIEG